MLVQAKGIFVALCLNCAQETGSKVNGQKIDVWPCNLCGEVRFGNQYQIETERWAALKGAWNEKHPEVRKQSDIYSPERFTAEFVSLNQQNAGMISKFELSNIEPELKEASEMTDNRLARNVNLAHQLYQFFDKLKLSKAEAFDVMATYLGCELVAGNTSDKSITMIPDIAAQIADLVKKSNMVNVDPRQPKAEAKPEAQKDTKTSKKEKLATSKR